MKRRALWWVSGVVVVAALGAAWGLSAVIGQRNRKKQKERLNEVQALAPTHTFFQRYHHNHIDARHRATHGITV